MWVGIVLHHNCTPDMVSLLFCHASQELWRSVRPSSVRALVPSSSTTPSACPRTTQCCRSVSKVPTLRRLDNTTVPIQKTCLSSAPVCTTLIDTHHNHCYRLGLELELTEQLYYTYSTPRALGMSILKSECLALRS